MYDTINRIQQHLGRLASQGSQGSLNVQTPEQQIALEVVGNAGILAAEARLPQQLAYETFERGWRDGQTRQTTNVSFSQQGQQSQVPSFATR